MRSYLVVTCHLAAEDEEALAGALEAWPVLGCQVEPEGARIAVSVFLESRHVAALPEVCAGLLELSATELATSALEASDWLGEYRRHASPLAIGRRLFVDPDPTAPTPAPEGRAHLLVEPRQAFGTGSHESTRLVLELLEELDLDGKSVLDVGCGSGILALAARALGARDALGFDIDAPAVFVARQTVAVQRPPLPVALFAGAVQALRPARAFDVILVNMIPAEMMPFVAELSGHLAAGGEIVLSGILADQWHAVRADLEALGLQTRRAREQNEWVAAVCRPAPAR